MAEEDTDGAAESESKDGYGDDEGESIDDKTKSDMSDSVELANEDDQAFIDDRAEEDLSTYEENVGDPHNDELSEEIPLDTALMRSKKGKSNTDDIMSLPTTPKQSKTKLTMDTSDQEQNIALRSSKGKGKVIVKHLDAKISMPAVVPQSSVMDSHDDPFVDSGHNPFLDEASKDAYKNVDKSSALSEKPSPKKKTKVDSGAGDHNTTQDTPVTRISRKLKASDIQSEAYAFKQSVITATSSSSAMPRTSLPDAVSNVDDPDHRKYMCKTMVDTYTGILAPPVLSIAKTINLCYNQDTDFMISFRNTMKFIGIRPQNPLFMRLRSITTQSTFGHFLYNLARADCFEFDCTVTNNDRGYPNVVYKCLHNLSGLKEFNPDNAVGFVMFGTVVESILEESFVRPQRSRDDKLLYQCHIVIRPLTMELQRCVTALANMWDQESIGVNIRGGGITFGTKPSPTPYPSDGQFRSISRSPNKRRHPSRDSSEEPDFRLPSRSIGGKPVAIYSGNPTKRQDEVKSMIASGMVWTSARVPVYDLTEALKQDDPPSCNQETLIGASEWL
ncbi:hypothetical protein BDY19DRAFT_998328 [Irpex rosettiformis]|uniref:Uncharacterized protein n=1 Tax=Irpex rosettiformis TaxID=378272 RepID=A0ACB8TP85_9APHY|nr:hypothetical protein BDY19DRAFT_998328 [Irpex rosettiformis]